MTDSILVIDPDFGERRFLQIFHTGEVSEMKLLKKAGIALGCIILFLGMFILIISMSGKCPEPENDFKDRSDWMSGMDDETLLSDIVIPGSHDSGTVGMNWMANTQNYTIAGQLRMGVRYLDLRVRNKDGKLVFYHTFDGTEYLPVLEDIRDFIKENPTEVLLLDFQHFDNSETQVQQSVTEYLETENLLVTNDT